MSDSQKDYIHQFLSEKMKAVYDEVDKFAWTNVPILLIGETGVGKESVAQAIYERSERKDGPFLAENCGVFHKDLLESKLFGHEKGAYTNAEGERDGIFKEADGGTLLLDEVGEMSPEVQVKFLRVLETQEFVRMGGQHKDAIKVNVRIIAATNIDLEAAVREGKFRSDLYYRLAQPAKILIPPLRERTEDIPVFVDAFINQFRDEFGAEISGINPEALKDLRKRHWGGNVRDLYHAVKAAIIEFAYNNKQGELQVKDFPPEDNILIPPESGDLIEPQSIIFPPAEAHPSSRGPDGNLALKQEHQESDENLKFQQEHQRVVKVITDLKKEFAPLEDLTAQEPPHLALLYLMNSDDQTWQSKMTEIRAVEICGLVKNTYTTKKSQRWNEEKGFDLTTVFDRITAELASKASEKNDGIEARMARLEERMTNIERVVEQLKESGNR